MIAAEPPVTGTAGAPLRVRLIGKSNGVGLSRDFDLLAGALHALGCSISEQRCERRERRRRRALRTWVAAQVRRWQRRAGGGTAAELPWDVNIMLEHVWPQFLHQARGNVLVPNPEWFDRRDRSFLAMFDQIWVKSRVAEDLFTALDAPACRIGFDSEDRYRPQIARRREFLHLAGRSPLKGTQRLLSLWRRHPGWPLLTVIEDADMPDKSAAIAGCANIHYHRGYLADESLRDLQNAHRFHLCPSEAEGWGHYIAEAMSVGAVTLTTDAPPMNELVTAERGVLIAAQAVAHHNLARLVRFDEAALERAVERCLTLGTSEVDAMGAAARGWFLANKHSFTARVGSALAAVALPARAVA
jgi:glycosyltransferase involved in cell wall biosynthesis